jgi:hypothetical protein
MEALLDVLMNAGPMGLFAAYLIWAKNKQDEKLENLTVQFFTRLEEIQEKHENLREALDSKYDTKNEQIRERWLDVVKKVESERDEAQKLLTQEIHLLGAIISEVKERYTDVQGKLEKNYDQMTEAISLLRVGRQSRREE